MEVYKRETEEIVRRFRSGKLAYADCRAELDAALAGAIPYLNASKLESLRAAMQTADEAVMTEMEMRRRRRASFAEEEPGDHTPPVLSMV